jgi:dihydroorotate dehydrogenase (fumarate)
MDLTTRYLGLTLRSPIIASAGPLTRELDTLARLDAAGVGAVVLPSLFEEQIVHEALEVHHLLETGAGAEAPTFFPELADYATGPDRYLTLLEQAKERLSVPVIASLNATSTGGWVRYAKLLEQAGADALELNVYAVAADPDTTSQQVEDRYADLVADVRSAVAVPLAVKLSPFFSALAHFARRLADAGADGLVRFNRFYQPDVDLETLDVVPSIDLSTSVELRLPLRWIAILRGQLPVSLAATSGVHTAGDVARALLVGADVAMMTSALLRSGPEHVGHVTAGLREWMAEWDYESVAQLRGSVSRDGAVDPSAFERANYLKALQRYSATYR